MIVQDAEVYNYIQLFLSRWSSRDHRAKKMLAIKRARISRLDHLEWWRRSCQPILDLYEPSGSNQDPLITATPAIHREEISRFPTHPDDNTRLIDFVQQYEGRCPTINALVDSNMGSRSLTRGRQSDYLRGDYVSRSGGNRDRPDRDKNRSYDRSNRRDDRRRDRLDDRSKPRRDDRYDRKRDRDLDCDRDYDRRKEYRDTNKDHRDKDRDREKKTTRFERKYAKYEASDPSYLAGDDTTDDSDSGASETSVESHLHCGSCNRPFQSRALFRERGKLRSCIHPDWLKLEEKRGQKTTRCRSCKEDFSSRNQLFPYLREGCAGPVAPVEQAQKPDDNHTDIRFQAKSTRDGPGVANPYLRGVNDAVGKLQEDWTTFTFYVDGTHDDGSDAGTAKFACGAWVQEGGYSSSSAALLGNGWMLPYQINVIKAESRLHVGSLPDFHIPFEVLQVRHKVNRRAAAAQAVKTPAGEIRVVPAIWKEVSKDRTFMFSGSVDVAVDAPKDIKFVQKQKLGNIEECDEDGSYFVSTWTAALTALAIAAPLVSALTTSASSVALSPPKRDASSSVAVFLAENDEKTDSAPDVVDTSTEDRIRVPRRTRAQRTPDLPEIITREGIHIYAEDAPFAREAQRLLDKCAALWIDSGLKDQKFIDENFDLLHHQGRMEWVKGPDALVAPVFVVWKTVNGVPKGRVVVDLRTLNGVTVPDSYPLPRQEHVIQSLREQHTSLPPTHRPSCSAEEHVRHLDTLFRLFISDNLAVSPKKSWIRYPSAQVLGFRVDVLGLSTAAERVAAFAKLHFPAQLTALEQYIGAMGYIRHLIAYFAQPEGLSKSGRFSYSPRTETTERQ
ncbi:reverse transcriptase [Fusarium albosuccineum]|uniref:Reverse transcriptase n=1 Tax=Fusarium albosuccineum TaxID=1237068 RepID=A0A8H4LGC6_9HYPO|nr:reverse transcriptase [Fusarium albosuccineum]